MLKALFGSGLRCAYPDCPNLIVEPGTEGAQPAVVGQICHIYASSDRGPRARPDLLARERDAAENLILLCAHHHALVDRRPSDYPVETLRAWKREQSEDRARLGPVRNSTGDLRRSAFFVEASDDVVMEMLARLRQGRVFAGFPLRLEADALAERVGDGDLAGASARVRAQALAWCARLIQHEDLEAAKALVDASRRLAACTEGEIADAIVLARKDLPLALAALGKIDDPGARTAAFRLKCADAGVLSALDWATASGLSDLEFDCDGRFFIVMAKLDIGDWHGAFASARTIAADDIDVFPALAHAAAMAFLATAVPAELRKFVLAQVPMGPLPLGAAAEIMEVRRHAVPLFERAAKAARSLGLDGVARNQDDYALWLRLYDPVSTEAAVADLASSMHDSEAAMRRVHLALQFGIEVDVVAFEKEVDRRVALTGGGTVTEAFALFALSQAKSDPRMAADAIGRHRALLYAHLEVKALRCVEIDILARAGMVIAARARLAEARVLGLDEPEAVRLERIIAEAEGRDPIAARSAAFEESDALLDLVALVQILEERHLWGELRPHAEELHRRTASIEAARLVARMLEETGDRPSLMAFFDANNDLGSATDGLEPLRAWTQYREGRFADARVSVRALRDARDDPDDRALETNIAISSGEWNDLSAFVASEWRERAARPPEELLRAAQLAQAIKAPLAAELLAEAAEGGRGDASILAAAYFQAVGAGAEVDPRAADWLAGAADLSDESGPLRRVPFAELLKMMPDHIRQQEMVSAQVAAGGIPLPLAARLLGRSVLDIVLLPSFANLQEPDLRRRMIVPAFSGTRGDAPRPNCRTVALDVTSILLLGRLDLLASAIGRFDNVLISHATLGWLFTERQRAEFHQPSRIKEAEEVSRLIAEGVLSVMAWSSPANFPAHPSLAADVGEDLAAMIDSATAASGDGSPRRVVRPAPVMRMGALGEEEVDLSAFHGVICSCSAVVDRLRASGALSADEEQKARSFLRLQERSWPDDPGVPEGCEIFLDELAVRYLQGVGLLAKLTNAGLVVRIGPSIEKEAKQLLRLRGHLADVIGCIDSIRRTLAEALRSGRVRVLGSSAGERLAEATLQPTSDVLSCSVLVDAVVCDDRFINRHVGTAIADRNTPILTTLDILDDLREGGVLSREAVFEHRTMLRRAGYALVPLDPDELTWFVEAAKGPNGLLIGTAELRAVRESLLAVRMSGMLDVATEGGWLHRSLGSVAAAIKAAWRDDIDPAVSAKTCDWLLEVLEVRGWVDAGTGDRAGRDGIRFQAIHILGLIASPPNVLPTVAQAYHRWLDSAVLEEMAEAEPDAFDWVVARVRRTIYSCLTESDLAEDAGLAQNAVADALLRTFPARVGAAVLADGPTRRAIGLSPDATISFGSIKFSRSDLFAAARSACSAQGKLIDCADEVGAAWRVLFDGRDLRLGADDRSGWTPVPSLALLAEDRVVRLEAFSRESRRVGFSERSSAEWRERLSDEPLDDYDFTVLQENLEATPSSVDAAIAKACATGSIELQLLLPRLTAYYERLVEPCDDEETLTQYVSTRALPAMQRLIEEDANQGFRRSLLYGAHQDLGALVGALLPTHSDLPAALDWLADQGDPMSQVAFIEGLASSGLGALTEDCAAPLAKLIGAITSRTTVSVSRRGLFSVIVMLVLDTMALHRIAWSRPPWWRRLAAFAHAGLVVRRLTATSIDAEPFAAWARAGITGSFLMQAFADLRQEPRAVPTMLTPSRIADEFGVRAIAAARRIEAAETNVWRPLAGYDDDCLSNAVNVSFGLMSGPLEGGAEPPADPPADVLDEVRKNLGAKRPLPEGFLRLAGLPLLFKIPTDLAHIAADAISRGGPASIRQDADRATSAVLAGLASVAAVTRSEELACEILRLLRRGRVENWLSPADALTIGLGACASHSKLSGWCSCVGHVFSNLAFGPLGPAEARILHANLKALCRIVPELWTTCGRAEAALKARSS